MKTARPKGFRRARILAACLAWALVLVAAPSGAQQAPARVMSLNVCTDQLAMLLARPGQLVSVSELAADPQLAFLHSLAEGLPKNRGLAEEVFVAKPDLVVTGTYSLHNTTALLKRLGFRVEEFAYAQTLDSIPGEIRRMAHLLGSEAEGEKIAASFEHGVKVAGQDACGPAPTAIAYDQNGIAMGEGTLVDSAMRAAGLRNLAAELGYAGMTPMPLELLVEHRPDIVVVSEPLADAPALADMILRHPALRALEGHSLQITLPRASASCGGPFVVEAVKALAAARRKLASCPADISQ